MKKRDVYFDNLRFFLITLVVIGHLIEPYNEGATIRPLYHFLYAFHMPLFVFISGYFSKNIDDKGYHKKIISKLFIPYLIFETLFSIVEYLGTDKEKIEFSFFNPQWIMWFLFSIVCWKVLLPYASKVKHVIPVSIIVAVLAGYAQDIDYFASISRTLVFFPFFLMGFYFKQEWIDIIKIRKVKMMSVFILFMCFILLLPFAPTLHLSWFYGALPYKATDVETLFAGLFRVITYVYTITISVCILSLIPRKRIPIVSEAGRNTMYVFILHGFLIKYLQYIEYYKYFNSTIGKVLLVCIGVLVTFILSSNVVKQCFKWLVEPKLEFIFKDNPKSSREKQSESTFQPNIK